MKPFWIGTEMDRESAFFIQSEEDESPLDFLLFTPEKILSVTSASEEIVYEEGRDYILTNGVNHPNDFGHRIYAQVITCLLRAFE